MKVLIFICCIFSFLLISCNKEDKVVNDNIIPENINKPDSTIDLAGYRYGLYENVWYTITNDYKGDLVDTDHIILRLVNDGNVSDYNFENIGLPKLSVKSVTDAYYEVEIPDELNPFVTGKQIWDSNDFKELVFNVFVPVH